MKRLGWLPEVSPPALHVDLLSLPPVNLPTSSFDMIHAATNGGVLDQGRTSSCVAQAVAAGMRVLSGTLPSRRWLYYFGRCYDSPGAAVVDRGTRISSVCACTRELGWPGEEHMPFSESSIDDAPTLTARRHAHDQRGGVLDYAITTAGGKKVSDTKSAICAGHPVVFGAYVDSRYMDLSTWDPYYFSPPFAGGHAQLAVGYQPEGVIVLNSWGADWGVGGLCLLSWECWREQCVDLRVLVSCTRPSS